MMCLTWKGPRCPGPADYQKCSAGNWLWWAIAAAGLVALVGGRKR